MNKKKLILFVAMSAVTVSSVSLAAACSHKHSFEDKWSSDATNHWHAATCDHKDEKLEVAAHTYGDDYVCTVCEYKHAHTYAEGWTTSATEHWHASACGHADFISGKAPHDFGGGNKCKDCDYEKTGEKTLSSITLDTAKVKTEYYIGETFTSAGISCTALYSDGTSEPVRSFALTIDSNGFDNTRVGECTINVSFTDGETKTAQYKVNVNSAELVVDTSEAALQSLAGDELDKSGIKLSLTKTSSAGAETVELKPDDVNLTVNWDAVDAETPGEYTVNVSYLISPTVSALTESFTYTVLEVMEGLEVTLKDGVLNGVYHSENVSAEVAEDGAKASILIDYQTKAEIDLSKVSVRRTDKLGNVEEDAPQAEGVTYKVFLGQTEIQQVEGKYLLGEGVYQVWAYAESEIRPDYELSAFVLLYVTEDLVIVNVSGLEFKSGTRTQVFGVNDLMSSDWKFTAKYDNGTEKEITAADLNDFELATAIPGSKSVKVTYTDVNAREEETTVETTVNYTITKTDNDKIDTKSYSYAALPAATADKALTQADLTGVNSFLTILSGSPVVNQRPKTDNGIIEIRNDALSVTFKGIGELVIGARSTGNSNTSAIAVKDSSGAYMKAAYNDKDVKKADDSNVYVVSGSGFRELTFKIPAAGVYTITTVGSSVTVGGSAIGTGRNTRINKIDLTDVIKDGNLGEVDEIVVDRIELDTENVKTTYIIGETLDTNGLVVNLHKKHTVSTEPIEPEQVTGWTAAVTEGSLDKIGKATVTVTYVHGEGEEAVTKTATYEVTVNSKVEGVNSVTAVISKGLYETEEAGADIAVTTVTVKNDKGGSVEEDTNISAVTYALYKAAEYGTDGATATRPEDGSFKNVALGDYVIEITATYNNLESIGGTTDFTAIVYVRVAQKAENQAVSTITFGALESMSGDIAVSGETNVTASVYHETEESFGLKEGASTIPYTNISYTKYVNTGGASRIGLNNGSAYARRTLLLTLSAQYTKYKVVVYADGNGTAGRKVAYHQTGLATPAKLDFGKESAAIILGGDLEAKTITATVFEITLTAESGNKIYLGGNANINIYAIEVIADTTSAAEPEAPAAVYAIDTIDLYKEV